MTRKRRISCPACTQRVPKLTTSVPGKPKACAVCKGSGIVTLTDEERRKLYREIQEGSL